MQPLDAADPRAWASVAPHYAALAAQPLAAGDVPAWLRHWSDVRKVVWEGWTGVKAAQEHDLADATAQAALQRFTDQVMTPSEVADAGLAARLLAVPDWTPAPEHAQLARRLRATAGGAGDAAAAAAAAALAPLVRRYEALGPTLAFTLDGRVVPKPELDRQLRSPERGRREAAWRAREAAWGARRAELDALWRALAGGRRELARAAGHPDFRAYHWRRSGRLDYAPADCLALHEAVAAEVVPLAARRWEARRAALGVATLRPWDLLADPGRRAPAPAFADGAAFVAGVAPVLAALDPELGALYARMGAADALDVGWAPGKRGGGTERPFPRTGLPFVRVGEAGTETGTGTLLHELGHAFHDHLTMTREGGCLAWDLEHPDEFSELAAFALYFQAAPLLGRPGVGPWPPAAAADALAAFLEETLIATLPALTLADAFQHWAYAEAPAAAGAAEADAAWRALTARYTPWVDWSGLEPVRGAGWQRGWSLFLQPFYDLTYVVAMVGALQVWHAARRDGAGAWRRYRAALALGGTRPLPELFAAVGARWPFHRAALQEVVGLLEATLSPEPA